MSQMIKRYSDTLLRVRTFIKYILSYWLIYWNYSIIEINIYEKNSIIDKQINI